MVFEKEVIVCGIHPNGRYGCSTFIAEASLFGDVGKYLNLFQIIKSWILNYFNNFVVMCVSG